MISCKGFNLDARLLNGHVAAAETLAEIEFILQDRVFCFPVHSAFLLDTSYWYTILTALTHLKLKNVYVAQRMNLIFS